MKKDITEQVYDVFLESQMNAGIIRKVCIIGGKLSKNNREYTDQALDDLTQLTEGNKCYLNHPSKSELKERNGIRDLRDFVGVFRNAKRIGDKVFASLHVRESFRSLLNDIISIQPQGVGLSLNGQAVTQESNGREQVVSLPKIRSVDLVASAASTSNLFEGNEINESKPAWEEYLEKIGDEDKQKKAKVDRAAEKFMKKLKKR